MASDKLKRLIELADKVFAARKDPNQLNVNEEVIKRLQSIHPMTLSEYNVEDGPVAWLLIIPTTKDLMDKFLKNEINERELFERTPLGIKYDSIYLCSALVLDEFRRKGITKQLVIKAIKEIKKDHPLKWLFVWAFTKEGDIASEKIAEELKMTLYKKITDHI